MPTPSGATSAYATTTDLSNARDYTQMLDWCLDGTAVRGSISLATFIADTIPNAVGRLTWHLMWAAGLIEAATFKGEMYLVSDLQALTGNSLSMLKSLNAWLAIMSLSRRKSRTKTDDNMIAWALGMLDELEHGEKIFALAEVADAGLAVVKDWAPEGSRQWFERPSIQAMPMFGVRGGRGYYGF